MVFTLLPYLYKSYYLNLDCMYDEITKCDAKQYNHEWCEFAYMKSTLLTIQSSA
jgi:hypothetical protein